ncbi:hypothetical protein HD554DRAFT_2040875 [Boletus coccyginus]|nr:hypothetical protein HD554DRAFT_2040875 [Boletus coccyginus]
MNDIKQPPAFPPNFMCSGCNTHDVDCDKMQALIKCQKSFGIFTLPTYFINSKLRMLYQPPCTAVGDQEEISLQDALGKGLSDFCIQGYGYGAQARGRGGRQLAEHCLLVTSLSAQPTAMSLIPEHCQYITNVHIIGQIFFNTAQDSFYSHEQTSKLCTQFITHLLAGPPFPIRLNSCVFATKYFEQLVITLESVNVYHCNEASFLATYPQAKTTEKCTHPGKTVNSPMQQGGNECELRCHRIILKSHKDRSPSVPRIANILGIERGTTIYLNLGTEIPNTIDQTNPREEAHQTNSMLATQPGVDFPASSLFGDIECMAQLLDNKFSTIFLKWIEEIHSEEVVGAFNRQTEQFILLLYLTSTYKWPFLQPNIKSVSKTVLIDAMKASWMKKRNQEQQFDEINQETMAIHCLISSNVCSLIVHQGEKNKGIGETKDDEKVR